MVTNFSLTFCSKFFEQILSAPDLQADEFIDIAFSPDSRFLTAQGGKPDWMLVFWTWEKGKILTSTKPTNQTGQSVNQVICLGLYRSYNVYFELLI